MNPFMRHATFYLLIAIVVIALISYFQGREEIPRVDYIPNFIDMVEKQEIRKVVLEGMDIKAELRKETEIDGKVVKKIKTTKPDDDNLTERLEAKNIQFEAREVSTPWWSALTYMIPFVLLIGLFFFFMQQTQGGGSRVMNFGKSKARLHDPDRTRVTFNDVAGADEEKAELEEIVGFLKDPKKYISIGARIPKGVLLVGPPGTGKTLLARAVAGEADVPFFSISGSDFVEMFVGVGASRVRDLFKQAKANKPCIIFMDEIDAVGRHRGAGLGGGHDEREQTLNQLLVEMDGFDQNAGVILIAATNRPDILDPALLRPGRFDRRIVVDRPDLIGREQILKVHAKGKPLDKDVDLNVLARRTPGFTGSDIANLVNEAALLASRNGKKLINMAEFEASIDRVIAGPEKKSRIMNEKEKEIVAYHESGHALVAKLLPNCDPVHKVSIIPRGSAALGYTLQLPTEDRYLVSKSELMDRLSVLLAGRVAEEITFKDVTTGAQNDLERATKIARQMVTEFGMSESIGPIALGRKEHQVFLGRDIAEDKNYSDEVAFQIDKEVEKIIESAYSRAKELLVKNKTKLKKLATQLLEKETLEKEELDVLLKGVKLATGLQVCSLLAWGVV